MRFLATLHLYHVEMMIQEKPNTRSAVHGFGEVSEESEEGKAPKMLDIKT